MQTVTVILAARRSAVKGRVINRLAVRDDERCIQFVTVVNRKLMNLKLYI
jgi:hypothetical protein